MFKSIIFISFSFFCSLSVAQVGTFLVGNGGQGVVCEDEDNKIQSIEILDFYEGKNLDSNTKISLPNDQDMSDLFNTMLNRLRTYGDKLPDVISFYSRDFFKESLFLSNVELTLTEDSFHGFLPNGCKIRQIIIQKKPTSKNQKWFIINKDLWDKLDAKNKAGLLLHEMLYKIKIINNFQNKPLHSVDIRQLVFLTGADHIAKVFTPQSYGRFINMKIGRLCSGSIFDPVLNKIICGR